MKTYKTDCSYAYSAGVPCKLGWCDICDKELDRLKADKAQDFLLEIADEFIPNMNQHRMKNIRSVEINIFFNDELVTMTEEL